MRGGITLIFIFLSCAIWAQGPSVILHFNHGSIIDIMQDIESQTDILFSYKIADVENRFIEVHIETDSIELILEEVFTKNQLTYVRLEGNFIAIKAMPIPIKGYVCGTIKDAESNSILPYATVQIEGSSVGTAANEQGFFELNQLQIGSNLVIRYVGYEQRLYSIKAIDGDCVEIYLELPDYSDDFLIIKDYILDGIDLQDNGASTVLSPRRIGSLPGAAEPDVLALAQFLPGISSPSSQASDIRIRGCTPDQNLILWENIPIYHAAHYFGMVSAINPFIIDEMEVYRGGFGAEYGGRIAGVMKLSSSNERDTLVRYGVGINMTHAYLYGHQFLPGKRPVSIDFSLRRSYDEWFRTPTFKNIALYNEQGLILGNKALAGLPDHIMVEDDIYFGDANIKISSKLSATQRLEFSGLFARNQFIDDIQNNVQNEFQSDSLFISNIGLSAFYQKQWNSSIQSNIQGIYTNYSFDYAFANRVDNPEDFQVIGEKTNQIIDRQIGISTKGKNRLHQVWEIGYQYNHYEVAFSVLEQVRMDTKVEDNANTQSSLHSLYVSWKNPIHQIIGVNIGLRTSLFGRFDNLYPEPRVRLSYALNDQISVHANYGRHYQFISQVQEFRGNNFGISASLWALSERNKIPVQSADLFQIGSVASFGQWVFDIQAYRRTISNLSSRAHDIELVDRGQPIVGSADILGLDILIKKRYKNLKSWLSYSLSRTAFEFLELQEAAFLSDFDQTHVLQWSNKIRIQRFELGLGLKFASGLPYSEIVDFIQTGQDNQYQLIYSGINTERLSPIYEINSSIAYNYQWNKHQTMTISFSVLNLFNQENIESREYFLLQGPNMTTNITSLERRNLLFTPNLSVRLEF